jgi:hypothetical protein
MDRSMELGKHTVVICPVMRIMIGEAVHICAINNRKYQNVVSESC